jgi:hypothetical protein
MFNGGAIAPSAWYFKVLGRQILRLAQIMTPPGCDGLEPKDLYDRSKVNF